MSWRTPNDTLIFNNPHALWASAALQGTWQGQPGHFEPSTPSMCRYGSTLLLLLLFLLLFLLLLLLLLPISPPASPYIFSRNVQSICLWPRKVALSLLVGEKNSAGILTGSCHGNRRLLPNSVVIAWAGKEKNKKQKRCTFFSFFFFSFTVRKAHTQGKKKKKTMLRPRATSTWMTSHVTKSIPSWGGWFSRVIAASSIPERHLFSHQ